MFKSERIISSLFLERFKAGETTFLSQLFILLLNMDLETSLEIVKLYYANGESGVATLRAYKQKHKLHRDPFTVQSVRYLVQKFETTGSVSRKPGSGRKSLDEERADDVEGAVAATSDNPYQSTSIRKVVEETGYPYSSVRNIM